MSVVLDLSGGRLPAVAHWGADLGELADADVAAVVTAGTPTPANNMTDEPSTVSILPEHWRAWAGRPGLSGSRSGRDWSPKFTTTALRLDGQNQAADAADPQVICSGPTVLEVDAVDKVAQLRLALTVALLPSGLLRSRARLTNTAPEAYQLDDLVLAYPVPQVAREILDLAGRWAKERTPQRTNLGVGVHLREGRRGYGCRRGNGAPSGYAALQVFRGGDLGGAHRLEWQPHPLCGADRDR